MKKNKNLERDKSDINKRFRDETLNALTEKRKEAEEELNRRLTAIDELFQKSTDTVKGERIDTPLVELNRKIKELITGISSPPGIKEKKAFLPIRIIRVIARKILHFFLGGHFAPTMAQELNFLSRIVDLLNRQNEIRNQIVATERELNQAIIESIQQLKHLIDTKEAELLRLVTHLPIKRMDLLLYDIGKREEELSSITIRLSRELENLKRKK
jgi:hypothetical protein